jgi:cobalt-zinc-cadmium efflux system membrane fusion protein
MWDLAKATNDRETRLFKQEISSEKDYLASKQAFEEARINKRTARQQLQALGLANDYIDRLVEEETTSLIRYEIRAPFDATVIERHITRGETVGLDDQVFFVAQLDFVWMMGRVTQRDIPKLKLGQRAVIGFDGLPGEHFEGEIDYIGSVLDPRSRATEVRVVLPNPELEFRAGMFGRMSIFVDEHQHTGTMLVPVDAVQRSTRGPIVYRVREEGEYEVVAVTVLHQSADFVEVQGPLEEGDLVSVGDTFVLKSEAAKEDMGGHSH